MGWYRRRGDGLIGTSNQSDDDLSWTLGFVSSFTTTKQPFLTSSQGRSVFHWIKNPVPEGDGTVELDDSRSERVYGVLRD